MDLKIGTRYCFDTTVFAGALRKISDAEKLIYQARFYSVHVGYSIITEAELWSGIRGMRTEGEHIRLLRPFTRYSINVTIARRAGEMQRILVQHFSKSGQSLPQLPDCLIAATADYHGLTICSANSTHFPLFQQLFSIPVEEYRVK